MAKNVLITGGNSGIGLEMARALAAQGHRVVIASRDRKKSEGAVADIRSGQPGANIEAMSLDLGDFADVDRFARELLAKMPVIDILMLNSGLYTHKLRLLPTGLESMIGIMHFGHFRLAQRLLEAVKAADQGRIVVTSSVGHKAGKINEAAFTDPSQLGIPFRGYAQAKLANLLFTRELARRLQGSRVTVNAFHPGAVATGIWAELPKAIAGLIGLFLINSAKGADTAVWLATSPDVAGMSGEYFVKRKVAASSAASRDTQLSAKLWEISERVMREKAPAS
jgi:NAD(P)-dependent dehydrogenase (short-subunit alcohol dehydrogenase family)